MKDAIVPCNGCVLCCQGEAIYLVPEDKGIYHVVPTPDGRLMLAHKPNGDCVYLSGTKCTIYEIRPTLCRTFDCRAFAVQVSIQPSLAGEDIKSAVLERGRELLR